MNFIEKTLCKFFHYLDVNKITENGNVLYLRRWFIWNGKKNSIYLHKLCSNDIDEDPHDHPWDFKTFVLWGSYTDQQWTIEEDETRVTRYEEMAPGKLVSRKAEHLHRVVGIETDEPAWTLLWLGKPKREWGFVKPTGEWIHYDTYLKGKNNNSFDGE